MLWILAESRQMKIPRHDAIKRNTYVTHTSLLLYFSAPGERQLASNRTPFSGQKEMVTILLERREFIRATHFTSADLFLGCSVAMAVGSKLWSSLVDNLLPLTALLLKGQSDCEIPAKFGRRHELLWEIASGPILASDQRKRIWERC